MLIKIVLLAFLKMAFFSAPPAKGPEEQVQRLLDIVTLPVSVARDQTS